MSCVRQRNVGKDRRVLLEGTVRLMMPSVTTNVLGLEGYNARLYCNNAHNALYE